MIKDICPYCEKVTNLEFIKKTEDIIIKNILTKVDDQFYICSECGGAFDDPRDKYDILDVIKRMREKKPEEKYFVTKLI